MKFSEGRYEQIAGGAAVSTELGRMVGEFQKIPATGSELEVNVTDCRNAIFFSRLHVQSMFFMMNSVGAELMNATLSCDIPNYHAAGSGPHGELNLSGNVLQAGFNLRAVQLLWRGMNVHNQSMLRRTCLMIADDAHVLLCFFVCPCLFVVRWLVGLFVCLFVCMSKDAGHS